VTHPNRIAADDDYLLALGRAFYNFTYLEWVVVWTIVELSPTGSIAVPMGRPAGTIAKALTKAIAAATPPLSRDLRHRLTEFAEAYRSAIRTRNKLLHAHPHTAPDGSQRLLAPGQVWTTAEVDDAAELFEDAAVLGNGIFHGDLARERP
jgi:hypothetical protein